MLDINLKQLQVFVTAAQLGSFTRAAQTLYITQPTASAHIQSLEELLGGALFFRDSRRRITLTPLGTSLLPHAQDILDRCQALHQLAQQQPTHAILEIAASSVPAQYLVPALISAFSVQQPNCRYHLQKSDTAQVHELLEQGTVRIGFVGSMLDCTRYTYHSLLQDKLVLVASNNSYFQEKKATQTLGHQLLNHPMICREPGSGTRQQFDAYLKEIHFSEQELNIVAQMDQPESILNAVEAGLGVTVCSSLATRDRIASGRLLAFELKQQSFYRGLYLTVPTDCTLTPFEQSFVHFCQNISCANLLNS